MYDRFKMDRNLKSGRKSVLMLQPEPIPFQGMGIMMVKRQHLWFIHLLTLRTFSLAGRITGTFPGYTFNWHRKYVAFLGNYI